MRDRWCPNCERFVSPTGHGPGLVAFWVVFGLIVFPLIGFGIGIAVTPPGSQELMLSGGAIPLGGVYGIGFGLFLWLIGIIIEVSHYRPRCPICRTAALR
jgi:hypothetical protein